MPLLDRKVSAAIGNLQSLDNAIAFRLGRLEQTCQDCAGDQKCTVHSYDERLVERYQIRYAAAFSDALAGLAPDAIVRVMRPGNGIPATTALLGTAILTRLQQIGADGPVVTELNGQPAVIEGAITTDV